MTVNGKGKDLVSSKTQLVRGQNIIWKLCLPFLSKLGRMLQLTVSSRILPRESKTIWGKNFYWKLWTERREMTCFSEKNPSAHSRYLKADYELKPEDIRRLDKVSTPKVKKYVSEIAKFKNAMLKFDKSLLSNNGLHLRSPKLAIPHDFNKEVLNRIENR